MTTPVRETQRYVQNAREDMHVHSTFSDGQDSVADNLAAAVACGLTRIACVDHVRRATNWAPTFVATVRAEAERVREHGLSVVVGLEAKLLDEHGTLDLPEDRGGADLVYLADHQFPLGDGYFSPNVIRTRLAEGSLSKRAAVDALVRSTCGALARYNNVVVAHLFSVLPKVGLDESDVTDDQIAEIAGIAQSRGALVEVSEKWLCPAPRVLRALHHARVKLVLSTDSHAKGDIGRYSQYVHAAIQAALSADVAA